VRAAGSGPSPRTPRPGWCRCSSTSAGIGAGASGSGTARRRQAKYEGREASPDPYLWRAVEALPPRQRRRSSCTRWGHAVVHVAGGTLLGVSPITVRWHLLAARRACARCCDDEPSRTPPGRGSHAGRTATDEETAAMRGHGRGAAGACGPGRSRQPCSRRPSSRRVLLCRAPHRRYARCRGGGDPAPVSGSSGSPSPSSQRFVPPARAGGAVTGTADRAHPGQGDPFVTARAPDLWTVRSRRREHETRRMRHRSCAASWPCYLPARTSDEDVAKVMRL
jgi:hypothetical protein